MPQNFGSNPCSNLPACTTPSGPGQQSRTGSFAFPGSLILHTKRLAKGENQENYTSLYRLRYQVYCHETHFLNPENYPDGLERDEFNGVSEHFLTANAINDEIIGTVRLVRWSPQLSFPTAAFYTSLLEQLDRLHFPLASTAEISRLCISKQFRRRAMDGLLGVESNAVSSDQRRRYPEVILELFKIMHLASKYDLGITHWIATFENSLYRLLERYGVHLALLSSDEIDYYGKVKIFGASIRQMEEALKVRRPELYAFFCEQPENA